MHSIDGCGGKTYGTHNFDVKKINTLPIFSQIMESVEEILATYHRLTGSRDHDAAWAGFLCETIVSKLKILLRHLAVIVHDNILFSKFLRKARVQVARNPAGQVLVVDEDENMRLSHEVKGVGKKAVIVTELVDAFRDLVPRIHCV